VLRFRDYWWSIAKRSLLKARVRAEAVGFVAFLIIGIVALRFSKFPVDKTLWWMVFAVFVVVFLVEICFVTPHRRAKEVDEMHRKQLAYAENAASVERSEFEKRIETLRSELDQRAARLKTVDRLSHVMEKGRKFAYQYKKGIGVLCPSDEEINAWTMNEVNPILAELGMAYVARYNAAEETANAISTVGVPGHMIVHYAWVATRIRVLEDFVKELTSLS
jgi:hypothetical protein